MLVAPITLCTLFINDFTHFVCIDRALEGRNCSVSLCQCYANRAQLHSLVLDLKYYLVLRLRAK
jgi:hypothetical protein